MEEGKLLACTFVLLRYTCRLGRRRSRRTNDIRFGGHRSRCPNRIRGCWRSDRGHRSGFGGFLFFATDGDVGGRPVRSPRRLLGRAKTLDAEGGDNGCDDNGRDEPHVGRLCVLADIAILQSNENGTRRTASYRCPGRRFYCSDHSTAIVSDASVGNDNLLMGNLGSQRFSQARLCVLVNATTEWQPSHQRETACRACASGNDVKIWLRTDPT